MLWPFVANNTLFFYMSIRDNTGYPWITSDLRKVMRKRDRAYSKMQKHGNKGKYRDKFKMLKKDQRGLLELHI